MDDKVTVRDFASYLRRMADMVEARAKEPEEGVTVVVDFAAFFHMNDAEDDVGRVDVAMMMASCGHTLDFMRSFLAINAEKFDKAREAGEWVAFLTGKKYAGDLP
jgi:hypothetical protein